MRRAMGTAAFIVPLVALVLGPWLGLAALRPVPAPEPDPWFFPLAKADGPPDRTEAQPVSRCGCRSVDVGMRNDVSDVEIKTGDATVVNFTITYVAAGYGDRTVEVDQEAVAVSGDAVAGQVINVDARGPGCVNVRVHASNRVVDSEVVTGAATAINRSIVLIDPGIRHGDLEIDVEQEAEARSGRAIAGQVIGLIGGDRVGGCGGRVDLTARNEVLGTDVRTGKAMFRNSSVVRRCLMSGCLSELRSLIGSHALFRVCSESRCRDVTAAELIAVLAGERQDPQGETHNGSKLRRCPTASPHPTPTPTPESSAEPATDDASASAAPAAEPSSTDAATTPSPTPASSSATPGPCASASPTPQPTAALIEAGEAKAAEPTSEPIA